MAKKYERDVKFSKDVVLADVPGLKRVLRVELASVNQRPVAMYLRVWETNPRYDGPTREGLVIQGDQIDDVLGALQEADAAWDEVKA